MGRSSGRAQSSKRVATIRDVLPTLLSLATLGVFEFLAAQDPTTVTTSESTGFLAKSITVGASEHRYVVYVPAGYRRAVRWPLIVFLNGMGECGTDGQRHVEVGLGPAIQRHPERWPFVVVFPQKPDKPSQWAEHEAMVMAMLAATERDYAIDDERRFLTGLSQGGAGTWALGSKHRAVWAAIAPVCGYGRVADVVAGLKDMPIWAFHGIEDKTVPAKQSQDLVAGVAAIGGKPLLTLYERTAHNSWDQAYGQSALAEWLRLIVIAPLAAACVAAPERVSAGTLMLARTGSADSGRNENGTDSVVVEWRAPALAWTWTSGRDGGNPGEPRRGTAPPSEGNRRLAAMIGQLAAAGVFELPPEIRPNVGKEAVAAGRLCTIALDLTGASGSWQFRRELPATAEADPAFTGVVRAILAELDRAAAWR